MKLIEMEKDLLERLYTETIGVVENSSDPKEIIEALRSALGMFAMCVMRFGNECVEKETD